MFGCFRLIHQGMLLLATFNGIHSLVSAALELSKAIKLCCLFSNRVLN